MKLKKLPPQCIAPLRLKEITLHGIGSYYKPARLEIKPLTILCGTNGSGKSTWMKVLSALKEAVEPLRDDDGRVKDRIYLARLNHVMCERNLLNARLGERRKAIQGDGWDTYYGPLGSFSVTFACVKPIKLKSAESWRDTSGFPGVLSRTELIRGDLIRLRFTQHLVENDTQVIMGARFSVNGEYVECRAHQKPRDSQDTIRDEHGELEFSLHIGTESHDENTVRDKSSRTLDAISSHGEEWLSWIEQVVSTYCEGYFKISAIRNITESFGLGTKDEDQFKLIASRTGKNRYVGDNVEYTHFFRRYFSVTPVFDPRTKFSYCATTSLGLRKEIETLIQRIFEERDKWLAEKVRQVPSTSSELERKLHQIGISQPNIDGTFFTIFERPFFWQYLFKHHKNLLVDFRERLAALPVESRLDPAMQTLIKVLDTGSCKGITPPHTMEMVCALQPLFETLRDTLLLQRGYFRWFLTQFECGNIRYHDDTDNIKCASALTWARFLAALPESHLSEGDIDTLNEWALQESIHVTWSGQRIGLRCDSIFNWWSYELLGIESMSACYGMRLRWYLADRPAPVGYLSSFVPSEEDQSEYVSTPYSNRLLAEEDDSRDTGDAPSFVPGYFSAGLHQVAPILVQMNMMRMNEVLAVENPEVHLHPGLQLKFMEFFIENALIGKFSLIETHSDLMIRRVLRAINEEKLRQSWVNITFVDTVPVDENGDIWTSKVEQIKRDGLISNWPKGFLDDDVRESEDLMRAMYGKRDLENEEVDHE